MYICEKDGHCVDPCDDCDHYIEVETIIRCIDCKKRNKKKCPLVMVRLDVRPDGKIREVLEQNHVPDDFWCKEGERKTKWKH